MVEDIKKIIKKYNKPKHILAINFNTHIIKNPNQKNNIAVINVIDTHESSYIEVYYIDQKNYVKPQIFRKH